MVQRGISEEDVEYCLSDYHTTFTDAKGNPIYRARLPNGQGVRVVVAAGSTDPVLVMTVADEP